MTGAVTIPIDSIRIDGGAQPRDMIVRDAIEEYAELYRDGVQLPPVVVFHDGSDHWLADGFHRLAAAHVADLRELPVDVRMGTRLDAVLYGCGANATHGIRRTNADKRRAVIRLLEDAEWSRWSNAEIARRCGVSDSLVRAMRNEAVAPKTEPSDPAARNGATPKPDTETFHGWSTDGSEPLEDQSYPLDQLDEPDEYREPSGLPSARDSAGAVPAFQAAPPAPRALPVVGAATIERLRSVVTDLATQTAPDVALALLDDLHEIIADARSLLPPAR